jgi:hypothetical protein
MTIDEAIIFLNDNEFTFAKSYAKSYPHYYLQKSKCSNKNKYEYFIKLIRENEKRNCLILFYVLIYNIVLNI